MSLSHWARFVGWLAAETSVLVVCAAVVVLWLRSPQMGRTIWRATLTAVALVWIIELSGLREKLPGTDAKHNHFVLTAMVMTPLTPETKTNNRAGEAMVVRGPASGASTAKWPAWIWLGGSILLLSRFGAARICLTSRQRRGAPTDENSLGLIARWQRSFGLRHVQSQVWPSLRSPVAFGIFRPTVVLPPDFFVRFSTAEREAMLAHEMAHLAVHDPFWLAVSDAVIALAWWHPLVWWARRKLQFANEAAADEASVLVPGGAQALAECLVRLGRELASGGPGRALGVGGTGLRSQLAARIERLLREPPVRRPSSVWARWMPHVSAVFVALASAILPIQTGLSGSILAVLAATAPARAESPPAAPAISTVTNQPPNNVGSQVTSNVVATGNAPGRQWVIESTQPAQVEHASPRRKVSLLVQATILAENDSDTIGLDWVFGRTPTDNPTLEISDDGKALQASPPIHGKRIVIDRYHTQGQSAILKPEQFSALFDRIARQADILTAPVCITPSGLKARIATQKVQEAVTDVVADGGSSARTATVDYITDQIALGLAVSVIPTYEEAGRWKLHVTASETAFIGYDNYGNNLASVSAPGGKPIEYQIPHPHFRAAEADGGDSLLSGQTLALRGPLWTETTKTKGHFLVRAKTKTVRQRLYVFVTPTSEPYSATGE